MKKIFTLTLLTITLIGCNKEDISPIINSPAYTTLLLSSDLPDNAGGTNSTFQDAIILEDGKMLAIIDYNLFIIENNIYTEKLNSVKAIQQTSDGYIYVLGTDAIYTSTDNGESFSVQEKFVASQGQSYALDLYYNGSPNNILIKKIADGSYILWLYTEYNYSLGGTGFTQLRYLNFVFTSIDGLNWIFQPDAGHTFHPTSIDNNGVIYLVEINSDAQTFSENIYYTSNNLGIDIELSNKLPNAISFSNKLFNIDRIAIDTRFESTFQQWDGNNWVDLNPTLDEKALSTIPNQLIVYKVNFTLDGKMLLINPNGIFISESTF